MRFLSAFLIAFLLSGNSVLALDLPSASRSSAATATSAEMDRPIHLPVPKIETLPNGLEVVWFLSDHFPVVNLVSLVKSGSREDRDGKSGTAQLVAQLLDRGAGGMSAQQFARAVESLGASRFASVGDETFTVGIQGLAGDSATLLDLLGKMVVQPEFPEAEVTREHARLLDSWSHLGDYGESLASLASHRLMSAGTPYGRGSLASMEELKKVGREDVQAYYRAHFTPKNAVLMVVGRVDAAKFRQAILDSTFGKWSGEAPSREVKTYSSKRINGGKPGRPGTIYLVDRPGLTQAQVRFSMRAPLIQSPDRYALAVANAMLGEYFNSRLNVLIRDKLGLTYSIGSGFQHLKDHATFSISSATRNDQVGQLIRKTLGVLQDFRKGPIPAEEIQMAKEYMMGGFPLSTSTLEAVASRWLGGFLFNLGPEYLNEFVPKVKAVNSPQVVAAIAEHLDPAKLVITVAGDAKEIEKGLHASKFSSVQKITVKDLQ